MIETVGSGECLWRSEIKAHALSHGAFNANKRSRLGLGWAEHPAGRETAGTCQCQV
jgi:hypothetical protein